MNKEVRWHVASWGLTILLCGLVLFFFGSKQALLFGITTLIFYIAVFYVNVLWIMPNRAPNKNIRRLVVSWFGLLIIGTIFSLFLDHLLGVFVRNKDIKLELINTFLRNILFIGIFLFIGVTYRYIIDRYLNEKIRHKLETEKLKTELDFLRAQVNPHFLFNTLNNIYALAYKGSGNTADYIMKLADILRYMLYESNAERVFVSTEIHFLNLLLSLHQLRIDGTMKLKFSVSGNLDKYCIAPLILISLVENVIKHGILNDEDNPAVINISIENDELKLYTRNKIDRASENELVGIGLTNMKRRMELLYSGKHKLVIDDDNLFYKVNLSLQLL